MASSRLSPKCSTALALVATGLVAPTPVRAARPWSVTCGGCVFSGDLDVGELAYTGSCATDCIDLYLFNKGIKSMPGAPFADMGALEWLRLDNNELTSLETHIFADLRSLRRLYLNNNKLASLPMGIFDVLTSLTYVGACMCTHIVCMCLCIHTCGLKTPETIERESWRGREPESTHCAGMPRMCLQHAPARADARHGDVRAGTAP